MTESLQAPAYFAGNMIYDCMLMHVIVIIPSDSYNDDILDMA